MATKETVEQFTQRVVQESRVDIDIKYCTDNGIKFKNHEIDASKIDLFTDEKANKAAFDFVMRSR